MSKLIEDKDKPLKCNCWHYEGNYVIKGGDWCLRDWCLCGHTLKFHDNRGCRWTSATGKQTKNDIIYNCAKELYNISPHMRTDDYFELLKTLHELVEGKTDSPVQIEQNTLEKKEAVNKIQNEGFDYVMVYYKHFDGIDDPDFHDLREQFLQLRQKLFKYINKHWAGNQLSDD